MSVEVGEAQRRVDEITKQMLSDYRSLAQGVPFLAAGVFVFGLVVGVIVGLGLS